MIHDVGDTGPYFDPSCLPLASLASSTLSVSRARRTLSFLPPSTSLGLELFATMLPIPPLSLPALPAVFSTSVSLLARMALPTVALSYCWPCRSFLSDQFSSEDHWTPADARERAADLTVYGQ